MVRYHKIYFKKIYYGSTLNIIDNDQVITIYPTLINKNMVLSIGKDIIWSTKKSKQLVKYGINYYHNNIYLTLFYKKKYKIFQLFLPINHLSKIKYHKKQKKLIIP